MNKAIEDTKKFIRGLWNVSTLVSFITLMAFLISYNAIYEYISQQGVVSESVAWIYPLIIDFFVVAMMVIIFDAAKKGYGFGYTWFSWVCVVLFTIVSMWLNALHVYDDSGGLVAFFALIPSLVVGASTHVLSKFLFDESERNGMKKTMEEMRVEAKTLQEKVIDLSGESNNLQGEIEGKRRELKKTSLELNDKAGKIETLDKKIEGSEQKVKVLGAEVTELMREKSLVKKWFESIANGSSKAVQKQRADMVKLIAEDMGKTAKTARNNLSTIEKRVMSNGKVKAQ